MQATVAASPPLAGQRVAWLGYAAASNPSVAGGKTAGLSRLAERYRVPPGFCLTTGALAAWGEGACPPPDLSGEIEAAYRELARRIGEDDPWLAVRSSAVDEDGEGASFAGQLETVLGVRGLDGLLAAVGTCRASAVAPRVLEYRRGRGLPGAAPMAVLVQVLVAADVSLVAFSANPVTGARGEVVINASWGLGESIVGGTTTPDCFVVRGERVVERRVGSKERMTIVAPGGSREVPVPRLLRELPALYDEQVLEVARLAATLESANGWPVDIECAFKGAELYLLQCRPITSLGGP
ncbi:MAG TPA: PEP/pyruvate-binding domain-containing protein [Deinococcales bacterium]|nr:PEP/pyruvate-binding domain-containing protein [Deinococcales bacterium]